MDNKDNKSMRLNFYMKSNLVRSIDEYADKLGITRSAAISVLCQNQLDSLNAMSNVGSLSSALEDAFKKISEINK